MHVWESQRQRDQPGGTPGSPTGAAAAGAAGGISEASLPPDFRRKYDAWQQLRERQQKVQQSHPSEEGGPHHLVPQQEGQVCASIVLQWTVGKLHHLLHVNLLQMEGVNQQENLPLDFKRKLEAWEKMKGGIAARPSEESAAMEAPGEASRRDNSTEKKVVLAHKTALI